ncbi:MAG: DNA-processing protein DprA [Clostridia bacterium]|nr:DNA-processing protein DprA [Clostridia bacterium]
MAKNLKYWIWLSSIPKIGPVKRKMLLEHLGNPENIWYARGEELRRLGFLSEECVARIVDMKYRKAAEKHFEDIYKNGIDVITIQDETYPWYLKNIYDPPVVLYKKGKLVPDESMVAVVGSRKATRYGLDMAERIACELSARGIAVVSGMARGVDSYAHRGALKAGGRTIAVLGCGLDVVYPPENERLMNDIIMSGAVLSEYAPGVQPFPGNFPARNRIISGLSMGVAVIEAGEKSGSLITADLALEQGRDVFAVPGNMNSLNSRGTNRLIKEGAKIVTSIDDILEEIGCYNEAHKKSCQHTSKSNARRFNGLDSDEQAILEALANEPLHIDLLALKCKMPIQSINSLVIVLELKGLVEQLPGKIYKLLD